MTRQALRCGWVLVPTKAMSAAMEKSPDVFFHANCIASTLAHMLAPAAPTVNVPLAASKTAVPGLLTDPTSPWSVKIPRFPSALAAENAERKRQVPRILRVVVFMGWLGQHNRAGRSTQAELIE